MRVIEEQCPFSDVAMAKSKRKNGKRTTRQHNTCHSDERDSDSGVRKKRCTHISKSINLSAVRKSLKASSTIQCSGCVNEGLVAEGINASADSSTWYCLQCGYQGCGRSTKSQHGLKHWKQPRSDPHHIVLNTSTGMIWCYECDDELADSNSSTLKDAVAHVTKNLGISRHTQSRPNSSENVTDALAPTAPVTRSGGAVSKTGPKLKGLSNLGNTCFFNAVIQSLSQVAELNQLLNDLRQNERTLNLPGYTSSMQSLGSDYDDSDGDDSKPSNLAPISIQLGKDCMSMTDALVKLFKDMTPDDGPRKPLNPRGLFEQICKKVPRFKGYQQQDSHELLRNLLDSLKTEELMRIRSGIKAKFNWRSLDEGARKSVLPEVKCYGQQAKHTTIDSLFGGYLLSTVLCSECGKASQIFEPFLDLSLPVYEERSKHTAVRRGSKSVTADDTVVEERNEPSKHQLKKAAKNAKKNRKGRNRQRTESVTVEEETHSTSPPAEAVTAAVIDSNCVTAVDAEIANANDSNNAPSDSVCSSRSLTPKSELGYHNSDSEDSTGPSANGLASSLEKLSLTEASGMDRPSSARIRASVDMSLKPLADRIDCAPHVCSIQSSLGQFTHPELLTGANKFACSFCNRKAKRRASASNGKAKTVYTNARKQLIIYSPPAILTLHLKRFQQNGYSFSKVNRHVEFSINLDLAPYCSSLSQGVEADQTSIRYMLFAVVEHSGRLNSGHYTAYVRQRTSAILHKTMLQKPLYGQKPLTVLLERMSLIQNQMESRDSMERTEQAGATAINGEQEVNNHSRWYHISDTHVKEVNEAAVVNSQAYLLFYERVR